MAQFHTRLVITKTRETGVFYYPEEDGYVSEIRNNYIHEDTSRRLEGIDLDDGSSHYHVHDNVCIARSITHSCGDYRTVENNVFVDPSNPVVFWGGYERNHDRFTRNIIVISTHTANKAGDMYRIGSPPLQGPFVEQMDYNLFFSDAGRFSAASTPREGQPTRHTLKDWQAQGYDQHSLYADPEFVDPRKGDYRVRPESPAIKLGFKNLDLHDVGLLSDFPKQYR